MLLTDRRTKRKGSREAVNANSWLQHKQKHYAPKGELRVKNVVRMVQACGKKGVAITNDKLWPREITKRETQQKACPNTAPKPCKNQPSTSPDPPKSRLGRSWGGKIRPRGVRDEEREAHERPRRTQELPKKRPREPESRPRAPKSRPRGIREVPKLFQNPSWSAPDPD